MVTFQMKSLILMISLISKDFAVESDRISHHVTKLQNFTIYVYIIFIRFIVIFGDTSLDACVVMSLSCDDDHVDVYWRRRLLLICKSKEEFAGFKCHL